MKSTYWRRWFDGKNVDFSHFSVKSVIVFSTTFPHTVFCNRKVGFTDFLLKCWVGEWISVISTLWSKILFFSDINECREKQDFCTNGICQNTQGGATCKCQRGWELSKDGSKCVDNRKEPCFQDVICARPRTRNMTKQACCCSIAQAWGLNWYKKLT